MANAILWQAAPNSRGNVLSTELNALAAGSRSNAGTAIDNSANLDQFGWLELNVDFVSAPAAGGYLSIYMVLALDGTNYADGSSSVDPGPDALVCNIPILASTAAQNKQVGPIPLPGAKVKFLLANNTSQALPATGTTLELFTSNNEIQ